MPFTNREVAVIVANELNRRDPGMWFFAGDRRVETGLDPAICC